MVIKINATTSLINNVNLKTIFMLRKIIKNRFIEQTQKSCF